MLNKNTDLVGKQILQLLKSSKKTYVKTCFLYVKISCVYLFLFYFCKWEYLKIYLNSRQNNYDVLPDISGKDKHFFWKLSAEKMIAIINSVFWKFTIF